MDNIERRARMISEINQQQKPTELSPYYIMYKCNPFGYHLVGCKDRPTAEKLEGYFKAQGAEFTQITDVYPYEIFYFWKNE